MIRRLDVTSDGRVAKPEWPASDLDGTRSRSHLFVARKSFRKIVVMIDAEVMDADVPWWPALTKHGRLVDLFQHDLVCLDRYADDGPPAEVQPLPEYPDLYEGWAVVMHSDPVQQIWGVGYVSASGGHTVSGVLGNGGDVAEGDVRTTAYADLSVDESASRRRADWLAAQVAAQALHADLYVTDRPYLHFATWSVARGTTICRVSDALPLLGLYLRAQGEFLIAQRSRFNHGLFYWVGTRELLPEAWRWFTACVQHAHGAGDDALLVLGASLLQRVQRGLEARDVAHLARISRSTTTPSNARLSQLDTVLVFLMAAVDVAARGSARACSYYRRTTGIRQPGRDRVREDGFIWFASAPDPAAVVDVGTASNYA